MTISFVLVAEGSSDSGLIPHLQRLCVSCGASEVSGEAVDFSRLPVAVGNSVLDKLVEAKRLEPEANLFFIHRDADSQDALPRIQEIKDVVDASELDCAWVAVVPIQETEAWLLLDETSIRKVASKPRGTAPLNLPDIKNIENTANPKERLQQALLQASEATGRRLENCRRNFGVQRKLLLERLPVEGPLHTIPSWKRMHDDLYKVIEEAKLSE